MAVTYLPFDLDDTAHAWVEHGKFVIEGATNGKLTGLTFTVKDVFDIAGHSTGYGNPTWLETHARARLTSPVVQSILDSGATLYGKVITDELSYSLNGDNQHYGTPLNSKALDCVPGGSSSGSAAAVAAGSVDFALGRDTGGSVRVPASYCGIWGLRTTHGAVPVAGVLPLQRSFDAVAWLASDPDVFERVGEVMLPSTQHQFDQILHLDSLWQLADSSLQPGLELVEKIVSDQLGVQPVKTDLLPEGQTLDDWRMTFHIASAHEAWAQHGKWIEKHKPNLAKPIADRFKFASTVTPAQASEAKKQVSEIKAHVRGLLGDRAIAVLPSSVTTAPRRDADPAEVDEVRLKTMRITCVAGLSGLPQVSIPLQTKEGKPYGVSLMGPAGSDLVLLRLAKAVGEAL